MYKFEKKKKAFCVYFYLSLSLGLNLFDIELYKINIKKLLNINEKDKIKAS